jgi:hypothetical protein
VKSRRHESLVTSYAQWAGGLGFTPSSPHPEDLVLRTDDAVLLIEAKIVYKGNATEAVRSAVGQLTMYSHFLHAGEHPQLVALFSEDVGQAYRDFLDTLGIVTVWWEAGEWKARNRLSPSRSPSQQSYGDALPGSSVDRPGPAVRLPRSAPPARHRGPG